MQDRLSRKFDSGELIKKLVTERVHYLYDGLLSSVAISTVLAAILLAMVWRVNQLSWLLGWLACTVGVALGRVVLALTWRRSSTKETESERWLMRFRVGVAASGLAWGLGCLIFFPSGNTVQQILLALVMSGLCVGAVTTLGVDRFSTIGFALLALTPLMLRLGLEGGATALALSTMIVLVLVTISGNAKRLRRSLEENFWSSIESVEREQALLKSEARMNTAQHLARMGSFEWNLSSNALSWSNEHFRLWGLEPNSLEPTLEVFRQGIHPDDLALVEQAGDQAIRGEAAYDCVYRVVWPDGSEHHVHSRGEIVLGADGKTRWMQGTGQDISERVKTERALIAAKVETEQASRAKSQFLASMSHELRTPLNAVLGYAQLMEIAPHQAGEMVESAREIRHAGERLLVMLNDVFDWARIEAGRLEMYLEPVDVAGALDQCLSQHSDAAQLRHVRLQVQGRCDSVKAMADHRRLVQVFDNLVSNAIKYTPTGGLVSVLCRTERGERVRIAVSDTGAGLSAEQQSRLFEPFNRLGAERGQVEGKGLGLVITRHLVRAMGGEIGVESRLGQGSTFWVEFPVSDQLAATDALTGVSPVMSVAVRGGGVHVLVVEDYLPNQNVLRQQLRTLGCQADIASHGAEALEKWQKNSYDMILTDLNMPVMGGLELTRTVREQEKGGGRHIPIVAITAAAIRSELQGCLDAGMDDVLTKPLALEDLRTTLRRWTGFEMTPPVTAEAAVIGQFGLKTETSDADILDLTNLYAILGQVNLVQARDLVNTFLLTARDGLAALRTGNGDSVAIAREMHKQKSPARIVGALRYAGLAETLETKAKEDSIVDVNSALAGLEQALSEVAEVFERLDTSALDQDAAPVEDRAEVALICGSALVIDDDPVVLMHMSSMLSKLGVREVLTAESGRKALQIIDQRVDELEVLVCDLNMPEMDGVELIRKFGYSGFRGGLILMSGAGMQLLSTASTLAGLHGLRVLGQVQKPVMPAQISALLLGLGEVPVHQQATIVQPEVSAEAIRDGMAKKEFSVYFQPKVDAVSLKPVGVEALARWRLQDGSIVPPSVFITSAERNGMIPELSRQLISIALKEGARLHRAGYPLKIAVNLSGVGLDDLSLPEFVLDTVKQVGMPVGDVILEVTETGVMSDVTAALDVLTRLRLKGFGLSIDDFGIGYSSFEQLGRIPFTELKLDRAFVSRGHQDAAARAILEGSMDMARKLGLSTVAEGVETQAQLQLVRSLGCECVQGYLIARPMLADDLIEWLTKASKA
ncbi:MAG: EAL domain-containing protein [Gammaproteobacteria bacterium]|nr:EAL domain-containing protein [Gammaproteobacteria bacterium]MBU0787937.1 EAL domain-containing protein [Gammaproteobacteria bacterium]MBU0815565.1 EAL domain-containing protein [Gammaproteobacteria bacterium]MBU1785327.1 EAL domain-containing protein [Gammaproteobacteria bacterium]